MTRRSVLTLIVSFAFAAALLPATAGAETRTFVHTGNIEPTGGANTEGPASEYPASIQVSGVPGTVTKVTVTLIGFGSSSPADTDAAIVGPNGQQVMLMSDACGETDAHLIHFENWTFDDAAQGFLSSVDCAPDFQDASFKPSNYGNPDDDDLSVDGGPAGPYLNSLSLLAGGSPNGAWNLFLFDDNDVGYRGFDLSAWVLNLEVQPPPATPATPPTASSPAPAKKCKKKPKKASAAKKCKKKR